MFDLISDAIVALFASGSPGGRRRRTFGEELVWTLAIMVFPFLDLVLVVAGGPFQSPALALLLPFVFTAATYMLSVRFGAAGSLRVMATFCCGIFCLGASFFGALLAGF